MRLGSLLFHTCRRSLEIEPLFKGQSEDAAQGAQ